MKRRTPKQWY